MADNSQIELDLDKVNPQDLIDVINKRREIVEDLVNVAIMVYNSLYDMCEKGQTSNDEVLSKIKVLKSGIFAATEQINKTTDDLMKYKK